jgi:FkbM family methyltransferase
LERDLQRLLGLRSVGAVLDVGANEGQFARMVRQLGFSGRIVSVEPNPDVFARLNDLIAGDDAWEAAECALGESAGSAILSAYDNHQLSSLHAITPWAEEHWNFGDMQEVTVAVETLERFAEQHGIKPRGTLLKLDTQGHDLSILRSGPDFVRMVEGLQLEMPVTNLYEDAPSFPDVLQEIVDLGFRPLGFYPVQREQPADVVPIEFDGLFVRSSSGDGTEGS